MPAQTAAASSTDEESENFTPSQIRSTILQKIDNRVSSVTNYDAYRQLEGHPHEVGEIFESFLRPGKQAPIQFNASQRANTSRRIL